MSYRALIKKYPWLSLNLISLAIIVGGVLLIKITCPGCWWWFMVFPLVVSMMVVNMLYPIYFEIIRKNTASFKERIGAILIVSAALIGWFILMHFGDLFFS